MKVVFCSNYFNHHQLYTSLAFYNYPNIEYFFIATEKVSEERVKLGYRDMNNDYPFIIRAYENEKEKEKAIKICNECDVLIIGSAPHVYEQDRIKNNKLTFRCSERIFKKGIWRILNPKLFLNLMKNHTRHRNKNVFMLCASAYTAFDFSLVGAYKNKCYKWGYFPETKHYNVKELIASKRKEKITILWCARFIKLKHPEYMIWLAKKLNIKKYNFEIIMLGDGILRKKITNLVHKEKLEESIKIHGAVSIEQVRNYMEKANLFLFTSDQNEGWGAVINESMNGACAVVANNKIGSVPYLIKDMKNGCTYSTKKELLEKVEMLIENVELREKISENAYQTIYKVWNANNAVNNFIQICDGIFNKKNIVIQEGPCSKDSRKKNQ